MSNTEATDTIETPAKRKRNWFRISFWTVQALFVLWIVTGIAGASGDADDCGTLSQETCNAAEDIGTAIGVAFIVFLWLFANVTFGVAALIRNRKQ